MWVNTTYYKAAEQKVVLNSLWEGDGGEHPWEGLWCLRSGDSHRSVNRKIIWVEKGNSWWHGMELDWWLRRVWSLVGILVSRASPVPAARRRGGLETQMPSLDRRRAGLRIRSAPGQLAVPVSFSSLTSAWDALLWTWTKETWKVASEVNLQPFVT